MYAMVEVKQAAETASVLAWRDELGVLEARLGELFVRPEPRRQAGLYLLGLLSAVQRKNDWQLAEQIGRPRRPRAQPHNRHRQARLRTAPPEPAAGSGSYAPPSAPCINAVRDIHSITAA